MILDRLTFARFVLWAERQQDGGFHLTAYDVCQSFAVCRDTAYRWLHDYFTARGCIGMKIT